MSSIVRVISQVNRVVPVEVYPLVGMLSVACGFGVYTSVINTRKNNRAVHSMAEQFRFEGHPQMGTGRQ